MPGDMLGHERGDEEIGMVIAFLHADGCIHPGCFHSVLQQMCFELLFQKIVRRTLIDQKMRQACAISNQRGGIVFTPVRAVIAKIPAQRLLAPRASQRRDDGRKCTDRAKARRIAQGDG